MSLLLVTYVTTDCHMSPAPSLHTVSSDLLAFSCLQHFRCFGSRRSVVASLVPAVQRMGQPLSLPVPGAAAGNKCQSGEWPHALVPTALVPVTRPHLVRSGPQHGLFLLSWQQYHGVGLALSRVSGSAPASGVRTAGTALSPGRLLTPARSGWWAQQISECGFPNSRNCPRTSLQFRSWSPS